MNDPDYLAIVLDGLAEHKLYLGEHFQRMAEKAKLEGVDTEEFYRRLETANNTLVDSLGARLHEHKDIRQVSESGEEYPFSIEQMSINLFHFMPNSKYQGFIWWRDTEQVKVTINHLRLLDKTVEMITDISKRRKTEEERQLKQKEEHLREQQLQLNTLELALKTPTFWLSVLGIFLSIIALLISLRK